MPPEDIDDLFREKLDGHLTPPGDALWARLQTQPTPEALDAAATDRLDHLFQEHLGRHATPPARELWERLEDEHLRPKKRRAAAWWPVALAAAVALLLVAGGAGLWLGFPLGGSPRETVATQQPHLTKMPAAAHSVPPANASTGTPPSTSPDAVAANPAPLAGPPDAFSALNQKNTPAQATRPAGLASTASKARLAASEQSPRYLQGVNRRPDAAPAPTPLVARAAVRPATRPAATAPADEQLPTTQSAQAVAIAPKPAPAAEIVPARAVPAPSVATGELITVDVRNGGEPAARSNRAVSLAWAREEPEERRRLGGRLLQQAGHLVRGERVSLAEATGLPENVTVRATIGGRILTKSIQL